VVSSVHYLENRLKLTTLHFLESVAFTQNFAGSAELPLVLDMFKNRPEQISGFRLGSKRSNKRGDADQDEDESDVELDELEDDGIKEKRALFQLFVDRLKQFDPLLLEEGLQGMHSLEQQRTQQTNDPSTTMIARERKEGTSSSLWTSLKSKPDTQDNGFAFDLGDDIEE
jgi:hypothetical protein